MTATSLLHASHLSLDTPGGRPLVRDLRLDLDRGDRVALVGRNGVGKSSLLSALAGARAPASGSLSCAGSVVLVPQLIEPGPAERASPGQVRRERLRRALDARPDLLLLDEPTHDLDEDAVAWLLDALSRFDGALVVASHDHRLLEGFEAFFVVAESGCRAFLGSFEDLLAELERARTHEEEVYLRGLTRLLDRERHHATVRRRRQRKKNLGRLHELERRSARAMLNSKASYAQESQGKRAVLQAERLGAARAWTRAARRALAVDLPLTLMAPSLDDAEPTPVVSLDGVGMERGGRTLFTDLTLELGAERLVITGPNGAGKTTLLSVLVGELRPTRGRVRCDGSRVGYIAQNASNWRSADSLLERLVVDPADPAQLEAAAAALRAHRFPLALAERPLESLSPGERLRAALIALWQRRPVPELLVLDEPTDHLDFIGDACVRAAVAAWPGGLVVVSHDASFVRDLGAHRTLALGGGGPAGVER